jgi:hypothetical protein
MGSANPGYAVSGLLRVRFSLIPAGLAMPATPHPFRFRPPGGEQSQTYCNFEYAAHPFVLGLVVFLGKTLEK